MKELERTWETQHEGEEHWPVPPNEARLIRLGWRQKRAGRQHPLCQFGACENTATYRHTFFGGGHAWFCEEHGPNE